MRMPPNGRVAWSAIPAGYNDVACGRIVRNSVGRFNEGRHAHAAES